MKLLYSLITLIYFPKVSFLALAGGDIVIVYTVLSGKEPYRKVRMDRVFASRNLGSEMISTLIAYWKAV